MLFGVGYGTGVRIGYEQVYPLLFPKSDTTIDATQLRTNMNKINTIYNTIGGKEASNMGIAMGINNARTELENNPDFQWLEALELKLSGPTRSRYGLDNLSETDTSQSSLEVPSTKYNIFDWEPQTLKRLTEILEQYEKGFIKLDNQELASLRLVINAKFKLEKQEDTTEVTPVSLRKDPVVYTPSQAVINAQYVSYINNANNMLQKWKTLESYIPNSIVNRNNAIRASGQRVKVTWDRIVRETKKKAFDAKAKYSKYLRGMARAQSNSLIRNDANMRRMKHF